MGFPDQLKKARLHRGLTQQQVADMMGITNSTYCGYETGKRQPDVEKIKKLAKILHTSGDDLLETGFSDKRKEAPPLNLNEDASKKYEKLLEFINLLSDEEWEKVMDYAALLLSAQQNHKDE